MTSFASAQFITQSAISGAVECVLKNVASAGAMLLVPVVNKRLGGGGGRDRMQAR